MQQKLPDFVGKKDALLQPTPEMDTFLDSLMERCDHVPNGKPICADGNWNGDHLLEAEALASNIGRGFGITHYPNQLELVTAEQMMDFYATIGMPVMYDHPSRGRKFLETKQAYDKGHQGLAYELVINTNPCISLNMFENSFAMQALVISHAAVGHNSFFKNNKMFKQWTNADFIMDYLRYAKSYMERCEEVVGIEAVERVNTACHALQSHGVDRYKRPSSNVVSEMDRIQKIRDALEEGYDPLMGLQKNSQEMIKRAKKRQRKIVDYSGGGCENILYALEKESPGALASELVNGSPWMVEIIRIHRMIAQYFYPQKQTQVMNEGWASFWHYAITHVMWKKGYLTTGQMMEILESHTGVVAQPAYNDPRYSGINPYRLGWDMYRDIMFMSKGPQTTAEKHRFKEGRYEEVFEDSYIYQNGKRQHILEADWVDTMHYAMENHRDDEFVAQFLSPYIAESYGFFAIGDYEENRQHLEIIGSQADFEIIRNSLSKQYSLSAREPDINVVGFDVHDDQIFALRHTAEDGTPLNHKHAKEVLKHINLLLRGEDYEEYQRYAAELISVDTRGGEENTIESYYDYQ